MKRLPVLTAFRYILTSTFWNLGVAFRLFWPWLIVLGPIRIGIKIWQIFGSDAADAGSRSLDGWISILILVGAVISALAGTSIAVNWHRYIILAEVPKGLNRLRVDGLVLRYFLNVMGISFLTTLVALLPALLGLGLELALFHVSLTWGVVGAVPLYVCAILFIGSLATRMMLKVVGIAVGRASMTLTEALVATTGNTLRIGALNLLFVVCLFVCALVLVVPIYLGVTIGSPALLALLIALETGLNWIAVILAVNALTTLYSFFVGDTPFPN